MDTGSKTWRKLFQMWGTDSTVSSITLNLFLGLFGPASCPPEPDSTRKKLRIFGYTVSMGLLLCCNLQHSQIHTHKMILIRQSDYWAIVNNLFKSKTNVWSEVSSILHNLYHLISHYNNRVLLFIQGENPNELHILLACAECRLPHTQIPHCGAVTCETRKLQCGNH